MDHQNFQVRDLAALLHRRCWSLLVPMLAILFLAVALALLLPPVYKSTSTILIEDQEIPTEYVQTTVTSFVEKRLQEINQKIMSTSRLQRIIDRYDLYPELRGKWTNEEIIDKMRDDIHLEPISTEVVDRRTGRPTTATIAFTLSYEGKNNPAKVHRVASKLASLFLEENLSVRKRQASEATQFFDDELRKVKAALAVIEDRIAGFKRAHLHELPELLQLNMQDLHKVELNIERAHEQLRGLKEREGYLQSELAAVSPWLADQNHLVSLRQQLVQLRTTFSDAYPDVANLQAEIRELEDRRQKKAAPSGAEAAIKPDNPAYITLASQLTSTQAEIKTVHRQIDEYEKLAASLSRRIAATPAVENDYQKLLIQRTGLQTKYNDLLQKLMEARVAQGLEKEQKGERFTLIDPAQLPEKPYKPPRLAIMLVGLILGLGAGIGTAALREFGDDSIRDPEALRQATSLPVLAAIPLIRTVTEARARRRNHRKRLLVATGLLLAGIGLFHFLVMDYAILWAKLLRRLAL